MYFLKKATFTLMEILIVMMILTLVLSVTGVKVHDIYKEQQFLSEAQQVLSKLRTAQDLMLLINADVTVYLTKNTAKNEVTCYLDIQKPLEDNWAKIIEKPLVLQAIQKWEFTESSAQPLKLQFINGGMSHGTLTLQENTNKPRSFEIELLGYPTLIKQKTTQEGGRLRPSQSLYPELVYEKFYNNQNNR
jgi:type II secretory pathway pseudopilin PulG